MKVTSLATTRKEYRLGALEEHDLDPDPFRQFAHWYAEAQAAIAGEVNAMTLATATPDGHPSARTVLLKGFDERGLVFYTNYESQKGHELTANPFAAVLFYWGALQRQVRITGTISRLSRDESAAYFRQRPRGSQLGALVSHQSAVIPNREVLELAYARLEEEYADRDIPLPEFWGGFRLSPETFEYWQGRENRLHDRLRYRRQTNGSWLIERLSP